MLSEEPNIPDFDGLNDTTDTTIRGMWCAKQVAMAKLQTIFDRYQTEYLFRRACEYAMSQGVEVSEVVFIYPLELKACRHRWSRGSRHLFRSLRWQAQSMKDSERVRGKAARPVDRIASGTRSREDQSLA